MKYKWKTNQSLVNMKLCNRPEKGLWLLKDTFPPLSSWHLSNNCKENEKQRCKLHLKGYLEATKPSGHIIGERTAIKGIARRVFGMLQREGASATALRKSQQSTLCKKTGTFGSQSQEIAMQQVQRATSLDMRKQVFMKDDFNSKKEQLDCLMLLTL